MRGAAGLAEALQRLAGEAGARRVDDHDVGIAGAVAQVAQHLADVPREERDVADPVQLLVLDRAGNRLLADLDPPYRQRVGRHREADRADAAVEVVDGLATGQLRELAGDARTAARPSRCSSAGRRSAAPGSGGRRSPLRSRPRPRAARWAGWSPPRGPRSPTSGSRRSRETPSAPRSAARGRTARRVPSRAARAPGRCFAPRGRRGDAGSPRASPGCTPDSFSSRAHSRIRLRIALPRSEREPALLDLEHLVPAAGLVQAERGRAVRLGERVLHLVAVVELRDGGHDRLERKRRRGRPAAAASRRPSGASRRAAPRRPDPGSGSRRTPGSAAHGASTRCGPAVSTSVTIASAWRRWIFVTRARTVSPGRPRRTKTTKPSRRATPFPPKARESMVSSSSWPRWTGAATPAG